MKILVADDNDLGRQMISDIIGLMGHEVSTACDGPSALPLNSAHDLLKTLKAIHAAR